MGSSTAYISVGSNVTPFIVDWSKKGQICYGASNFVVTTEYHSDKSYLKATDTLYGHQSRVNCVRWFSSHQNSTNHFADLEEFLSCSTDKTVIIWRKGQTSFDAVDKLVGHEATVTVGAGIYRDDVTTFVATSSADSTVKIWKREKTANNERFSLLQTLDFSSGFVSDVKWWSFPSCNSLVLACACDDMKVRLYLEVNNEFKLLHVLVGHEDWVRCIDWVLDGDDSLLASCAQDSFVRLWRFVVTSPVASATQRSDHSGILDFEQQESFDFTHGGKNWRARVKVEAVLAAHDDKIYSVRWGRQSETDKTESNLCLLSAALDKSIVIWKHDNEAAIWTTSARVGVVGGCTAGFLGAVFNPLCTAVLGHCSQGAFHVWKRQKDVDKWQPAVQMGGHAGEVESVAWEPAGGRYVLSSSLDKTTRLHALWKPDGENSEWCEIGRPQVHGYGIHTVAAVNSGCFVSGADEKIVRCFQVPKNFRDNLKAICNIDIAVGKKEAPQGASVAALGLSNKAVFEEKEADQGHDKTDYFNAVTLSGVSIIFIKDYLLKVAAPPTEENLYKNTLWVEERKLYGHGYEMYKVACNPTGSLIASSCKSNDVTHAAVLLWDTVKWAQVGCLLGHTLTVTDISFSPDGTRLLSVSRDRSWIVWKISQAAGGVTKEAFSDKKDKTHSRLIWACSWTHDSVHFVTASRDKKAVVWSRTKTSDEAFEYLPNPSPLLHQSAVTAASWAHDHVSHDQYLLATGQEDGQILVHTWSSDQSGTLITKLDNRSAHCLSVKCLRFRPVFESDGADTRRETNILLCSCGDDHALKIHRITCCSRTNELARQPPAVQ